MNSLLIIFLSGVVIVSANSAGGLDEYSSESCLEDSDCENYFYACYGFVNNTNESVSSNGSAVENYTEGTCSHKSLFPMWKIEYAGAFITIITGFIANSGGTAGGGIVIGVIMMFYGIDIKSAIAMSNFSVVFCAALRYLYNWEVRDPNRGYVLVDYSFTTLLIPTIEFGASIGAVIGFILPELIIVLFLSVILGFVTITTFIKFVVIWRKETIELREKAEKLKE